MERRAVLYLAGLLASAPAWGAALHGNLALSDSSNADRAVGASPELGIPQGHTLKVAIVGARFGGRAASGAAVTVTVRRGNETVATAECTLDEAGCGEVLIPVGPEWDGQYHVVAEVREPGAPEGSAPAGRLQAEFRAVESEPGPEVPYALPAALLGLAAVTLVIWWTRRAPRTA